MEQNKELVKTKSKTETYKSLLLGLVIIASAFLPFIHDLIPKGVSFPGYSSLRTFLYVVFLNLFGFIGWLLYLSKSKGDLHRFTILVPVSMVAYQLVVYIVNLKQTAFNEINLKIIITFVLILAVVIIYFKNKLKQANKKNT